MVSRTKEGGVPMRNMVLASVGLGLFLSLITGSRVTSYSGVDAGFSYSVALGMAATALFCIFAGMASVRRIALFRVFMFPAFLLLCTGSFLAGMSGASCIPATIAMGLGLGCGYLAWGDALARFSNREILLIPLFASAVWGVAGSCITLVDDYAARMPFMVCILVADGAACLALLKSGLWEASKGRSGKAEKRSVLSFSKALLPTIWKPTLLVSVLGFSSGILRVLSAASGTDPFVLSAVRFSCAIAVILLFVIWSKSTVAFETSPITFVLLLAAASALMLLPLIDQRWQIVLASVIDIVYLLAGTLLLISCARASRNEEGGSMLAMGYGQGVSILFVAAGFSISSVLASSPLDDSFNKWLLALGTVYGITIIVVAISMPQLKGRRHAGHSISMVLAVPEETVRTNRSLNERYRISNREMDVLVLALTGRNAAAIAEALFLSESTVRTHLKHIYKKLGVHSKEELHRLVESLLVSKAP